LAQITAVIAIRFPPVRSLGASPPILAKGLAQLRISVKLKAAFSVEAIHESGETLSRLCTQWRLLSNIRATLILQI
jgi:hypothetical protein